ncbi:MAG TPA: SDR family NAD(P)-dependent oxidoreductase [Ideonella sp.]|nr:SDR family NAD(P)-dependent oxidoreductase [Ideonella sp.]
MQSQTRVVAVTGAARGIGLGVASYLAAQGLRVALFDKDGAALDNTVTSLTQQGFAVRGFVADMTSGADVKQAVRDAEAWAGPALHLVNNAGAVRDTRFLAMSDEDWDLVLATNLRSQFICCRAMLPAMVEHGYGRIVNMSARAWLGGFGQANYSAAKGGVVSLTRSLAIEFAAKGVTVNAIAPGIVDTPLFRNFKPEVQQKLQATVPVRRIGTPEDVARAVAYFLEPANSYVTGQTLYVCGGRSLSSASV